MDELTQSKIRMLGVWCGVGYVLLLFVGWGLIPGFLLPPVSPALGADQIAALFQDSTTRIRIGMVLLMFGAMLFGPFTAVVCHYLMRIERGPGMLTITAAVSGAGNMVLTFYPAIYWLTAAFRPERGNDLVYLMNDMGWLQFAGGITLFLGMPIAIAVAAFCDKSQAPVFPRWSGYLNVWFVLLTVPNQLMFFFHTGPFAWNGLFGLWLPAVVFGMWFGVLVYCLRKAVLRERLELV